MATYFHGNPTELQAHDGLQTLFLMNPTTYVQQQQNQQFSDTTAPAQPFPTHNNLIFLNTSALSHHAPPPPHAQHFVGIPTTTPTHQDDAMSSLHGLLPRIHYNLYNPDYPSSTARDSTRSKQGLSLSLSSQQPPGFGSQGGQTVSGEDIRVSGGSASSGSGVTNGVSGMQSVLLSSKFLKAAQELLDEVVNMNNSGIDNKSEFSKKGSGKNTSNSNTVIGESSAAAGDDDEATRTRAAELTTTEKQEIQMKKAKLINMVDEVEQRYRQYHHQMQIVISSFEQAAGIGSAKTYTSLALKTISKQFRCLKDAITGQIKAANKMLGEEDSIGGKIEGSRLKFVDHHLRQQRALQQLGMIQHNAWRPQRGLPERSVSVLRAWLFEHFLHPYPKDSDKQMLAKQTGLTRSQVSNWFINARVRLWKPMVEEMYVEEIKEQEQNGSDDKISKSEHNEDSVSKSTAPREKNLVNKTQNAKSFKSSDGNNLANQNIHSVISMSTMATSPVVVGGNERNQSGFSLIGSSELEGFTQGSQKKPRHNDMNMMLSSSNVLSISNDIKPGSEANNNDQILMKFDDDDDDDDRQDRNGYSFIGNQMNFIQGFGQYPIGEIGRFDAEQFTPRIPGNGGVSLTLGPPHCENLSLSAATHQNFLPNQSIQLGRRVEIGEPNEFGTINTQSPHSSAAYESINIQNRKRFAAQLLPDFVS